MRFTRDVRFLLKKIKIRRSGVLRDLYHQLDVEASLEMEKEKNMIGLRIMNDLEGDARAQLRKISLRVGRDSKNLEF